MQTPSSEDKRQNLSNLLKIKFLSIRDSDKLSRQNNQIRTFNNTDTFEHYHPQNKIITSPNLTTSSFYKPYQKQSFGLYTNRSKKNKTTYSGKIPLEFLGKATLDCNKTFYTTTNEELKKNKKVYSMVKNKVFNPFNNEIMNINKKTELKFKTQIKFSQNSSEWYKFKKYKYLISDLRQREFDDLFTKILKLLDIQTLIFFSNHELNNNKEEEEEKIILPDKLKKIISLGLEIGINIIKFTNLIINELKEKNEEKTKLIQSRNEQEMKCNHVTQELDKLQKYCESYDISSKMFLAKARENTINNIKNFFHRKENEYKINLYKMEDEIKDLTYLLNKNKDYYSKYKEKEMEVLNNKRQRDEYKYLYNKEIQEKMFQKSNEKDKEEELNKKVNELEDNIDELKEELEINKRKEIESNAKLSKIMMILREKNENILMLNEELEWYIRECYKKNKELKALENRVFKNNSNNLNTNIDINQNENKVLSPKKQKEEKKDEIINLQLIQETDEN